jgi:hypothetical protein
MPHGDMRKQHPAQVQRGEGVEIRSKPQMVCHRRRKQPAEQVAGDIAGDIGGEGRCGPARTAGLAQVGQRQRERSRHAEPLHHAQRSEHRQTRHRREQQRRQRQHHKAQHDAAPSVDATSDQCHSEARDRHADRACVDRQAHHRRCGAIGTGQGWQDRLRGEQIDDGEEGGQSDQQRTQRSFCSAL